MNINTESSPSSPAPIEARVQTKKLRPQRSKEEWFSLLDIWYTSDIRVNAFLAQYDLSEPSFYSMRKRYAIERARPYERDISATPKKVAFVPAQLPSSLNASLTLEHKSGWQLRCSDRVSPQWLASVLKTIAS